MGSYQRGRLVIVLACLLDGHPLTWQWAPQDMVELNLQGDQGDNFQQLVALEHKQGRPSRRHQLGSLGVVGLESGYLWHGKLVKRSSQQVEQLLLGVTQELAPE